MILISIVFIFRAYKVTASYYLSESKEIAPQDMLLYPPINNPGGFLPRKKQSDQLHQ